MGISEVRLSELMDYASNYGAMDVDTPEGEVRDGVAMTESMRDTMRAFQQLSALRTAARKALNFIENTEGELGIKLGSGEALRQALS